MVASSRDVVPNQTMKSQQNSAKARLGTYTASSSASYPLPSEVHKAVHKYTNKPVALKRILMHNEKEGMPVTALREIKILKALNHPCIINISDMFIVRSTPSIRSHIPRSQFFCL